MSIISEIQRIKTNISNVYDTLESQGVDIPDVRDSSNLVATVESNILRTPNNCAGLCLWLDGDCNTRNGLDRSKKYFENLVWFQTTYSNTNSEYFSTPNNNVWNNNMLVVNSYALYPRYYMGNTGSITIEWVMKKTSSSAGLTGFHMASAGGYALYSSNSTSVNFYFNNNGTYVSNTKTIELNKIYYIVARYNYATKEGHLIFPHNNTKQVKQNLTPKTPNSDYTVGFGVGSSTISGFIGTNYSGGGEIGMVRVWSRALTDSEIQANYKDAKKRFGCI